MLKFQFLKKNSIIFLCFFLIFIIEVSKTNSQFIETYFSNYFYKINSNIFLFLFGRISFSVGDIIILILPFFIYKLIKRGQTRRRKIKNLFKFFLIFYIVYQFQWGLNYHRVPLKNKLSLKQNYELKSLIKTTNLFISNTNNVHNRLSKNDTLAVIFSINTNDLINESIKAVNNLKEKNINKTTYPSISIKKSILSYPLSYMGFSGYINPLTLEAQINKNIPKISIPTTIFHEIAHQIGYSSENEANFIGIMSAINSNNNLIRYSGNVLGMRYLLSELFQRDRKAYEKIKKKINKGVLLNIDQANKEWEVYSNPIEPYFKNIYDLFLKANNQKEGIKSYNLVVNLLVNQYD